MDLSIPWVSSSRSAHLLHIMELLEHTLTSRRSCIGLFQTTRNVIVLKLWQTLSIEAVSIYHLLLGIKKAPRKTGSMYICEDISWNNAECRTRLESDIIRCAPCTTLPELVRLEYGVHARCYNICKGITTPWDKRTHLISSVTRNERGVCFSSLRLNKASQE